MEEVKRNKKGLRMQWFYSFIDRWSKLSVVKRSSLSEIRVKSAPETSTSSFPKNLNRFSTNTHKSHLIYKIDEKGINTYYKPPYVIVGRGYQPQAIMAEKRKTVTNGKALGN